MLFYDENDNICIKINEYKYRKLYHGEIIEIESSKYLYSNCKFYLLQCNNEIEINYWKPVHERHLNIKELHEVFNDKVNYNLELII